MIGYNSIGNPLPDLALIGTRLGRVRPPRNAQAKNANHPSEPDAFLNMTSP